MAITTGNPSLDATLIAIPVTFLFTFFGTRMAKKLDAGDTAMMQSEQSRNALLAESTKYVAELHERINSQAKQISEIQASLQVSLQDRLTIWGKLQVCEDNHEECTRRLFQVEKRLAAAFPNLSDGG